MKYYTLLAIACFATIVTAQGNFDQVKITITPITDHMYMLQGAGGNIGLSTGKDGVFMIDDQFAPLSDKIIKAVSAVSNEPVRFLVNTHFHGDHSGGNANFEAAGAMIVAHDNVRKRLAANEKTANAGLPIITFSEDATFYQNGDDIFITHVHNAHTDGDALVYFAQSNILHTGDTFFNGRFPFIDTNRGGSIQGYIEAAKKGLMLINDNTKIIPGHGDLATKKNYQDFKKMLEGVYSNVKKAIANNKTLEEVTAMESLTSKYYTDKETEKHFISGPKFRATVYNSIKGEDKE